MLDLFGPNLISAKNDKINELPSPNDKLSCYRRSASIHYKVRSNLYDYLKTNPSLIEIAEKIESMVKEYSNYNEKEPLKTGQAFPTGVNSGFVAAHYSPNPSLIDIDNLKVSDGVLSIDFGVHTYGYLIDCAFSVSSNPIYIPLLEATKSATEIGIKKSGPDAILSEIGFNIKETMESFTVIGPESQFQKNKRKNLIGNEIHIPVKVVENLSGHSIEKYKVHAGKTVPCYDDGGNERMKCDEIFAIETFGTTGRGYIENYGGNQECSHYMVSNMNILENLDEKYWNSKKKNNVLKMKNFKNESSKIVANSIANNFAGLAFCKRWLDKAIGKGAKGWAMGLRNLEKEKIIESYPPLVDVKGSEVSQFEHTINVKENGVEILSKGDDY